MKLSESEGRLDSPERDLLRALRGGATLVGAALLILGVWMFSTGLGSAVIAQGKFFPTEKTRPVQHQSTGIVDQLLVEEGTQVKAGQLLAVIRNQSAESLHRELLRQQASEGARRDRLLAEQALQQDELNFSPAPADFPADQFAAITAAERKLFQERIHTLQRQESELREQLSSTQDQIKALKQQITHNDKSTALLQDQRSRAQPLFDKNLLSQFSMMDLERSIADYQARGQQLEASLASAVQHRSELERQLAVLRSSFTERASTELVEGDSRQLALFERIKAVEDTLQQSRIVAPVDGVVTHMQVAGPGTVIPAGGALLEIVPLSSTLMIEAQLPVSSVNDVQVGQPVDIYITGLPRRSTPTVTGKLVYVGADRMENEADNSSYYVAHIAPDEASLKSIQGLALRAGMAAEVHIRTRDRTPIDYFLEPITATMQRAMRER